MLSLVEILLVLNIIALFIVMFKLMSVQIEQIKIWKEFKTIPGKEELIAEILKTKLIMPPGMGPSSMEPPMPGQPLPYKDAKKKAKSYVG